MTIYRVQDRDGRGPWRPGFSEKWVVYTPEKEALPPIYIEVPWILCAMEKRTAGHHVGVGCCDLDQLRRWFSKAEYRTLMGYGFRCVKFLDKAILVSTETQLVFESSRPLAEHGGLVSLYGEEIQE